MGLKRDSIIGCDINSFLNDFRSKERYYGQKARLIPEYKLGDEMALTSSFLSSLKLIKEFRKFIFTALSINNSGKFHSFTEVCFVEENKRIDGLIVVERGGKIVDAALFEMKNGKSHLEHEQISNYLDIAEKYSIPRLVTISNQFVSHPEQSPISGIKPKKSVNMYHLSWSYILTLAYVLLTENDTNIEDSDQVEIMKEVVDYFEHPKSGVLGFTEMKDGWSRVSERLIKGENFVKDDKDIEEAVESWLQEEKDMTLKLSRQLGILVQSGNQKYRNDLKGRIDDEKKKLTAQGSLDSVLKISGAASPITVTADFNRRTFEFKSQLTAPQGSKTLKGQVGWLKRQLKKMEDRNEEFSQIRKNLMIDLKVKNKKSMRKSLDELDLFSEKHKSDYLKEFEIILCCDLNSKFLQKRKVIEELERTLSDYYRYVISNMKKWVKPAPEIKNIDIQDA